jgi:hypothetical protein
MKNFILLICLLPIGLTAQDKTFASDGAFIGHMNLNMQTNIGNSTSNKLVNSERRTIDKYVGIQFFDISYNFLDKLHCVFAVNLPTVSNINSNVYNYLEEKYPGNNVVYRRSSYGVPTNFYFGVGYAQVIKKFTLIPYATIGRKQRAEAFITHITMENDANNLKHSFFIQPTNDSLRINGLSMYTANLHCRAYYNSGKALSLYAIGGMEIYNKKIDLRYKERDEYLNTEIGDTYKYNSFNINPYLSLGVAWRLFRVKTGIN